MQRHRQQQRRLRQWHRWLRQHMRLVRIFARRWLEEAHDPHSTGRRRFRIQVRRLIVLIDRVAVFLCARHYQGSNPVLSRARMPLLAGIWSLAALVFISLVWGSLAPIESGAVAHGSVVLLSNKKTVQHLEGGIIRKIYIREGDYVQKGQKLIQLDSTLPGANLDMVKSEFWAAKAAEARLEAEREGKDKVNFPAELAALAQTSPAAAKVLATQRRLFAADMANLLAQTGMLNQRIAESDEEVRGMQSQISGIDGQLVLLDDEITSLEDLYNKGYVTKKDLLTLKRKREELGGSRGQYEAGIARARQTISETKLNILSVQNDFSSKKAQELRDLQVQLSDLQEKNRAAQDIVNRTMITAPASGVVKGLKFFTVGGVIDPRTPIMDIIPQNDQLILEAHVQPTDIDVVHANMPARIMLTAYKSRLTPTFGGRVTQVSPDKFTDSGSGESNASYYIARVVVNASELKALKEPVELYPGMPADVLILTGSRSFLNYLLKPLSDSLHRSFREE